MKYFFLTSQFQAVSVPSDSGPNGNFNHRNTKRASRIEISANRRDRPKRGVLGLALAIVLFLSPSLAGATTRPIDFAYGRPLFLKETGAVYRLDVPLEVYKTVSTNNLSDIRIFNRAEVAVPHMLRRQKTEGGISEDTTALPFFPLYQKENETGQSGLSVRINKGEDGAIIDIESDDTGGDSGQTLSGYLIDISRHRTPIDALDLTWPVDTEDFVADVALEYSDDLTKWTTIVLRSTIVLKRFGGEQIVIRRIQLPQSLYRKPYQKTGGSTGFGSHPVKEKPDLKPRAGYFRLGWLPGSHGPELKEVLAVHQTGKPRRERIWTTIDRIPEADDSDNKTPAYDYDSSAWLPVDQIQIGFTEKNTLAKVKVFSKPDLESKWRYRQGTVLYNLEFDKTALIQDTIHTDLTSDRYWRLQIEGTESSGFGKGPAVKLGWLPHELLFVAQGEGPFVMAYGSARLEKIDLKENSPGLIAQVIGKNEDTLIKEASLSQKIVLGGPDLLVPLPPPLPWKDWLLWCVLVAGVGTIAKMAINLFKGMDNNR